MIILGIKSQLLSQCGKFGHYFSRRASAVKGLTLNFNRSAYFFCSQNLITNLAEVREGRKSLQERNINKALEMYERAFNILPFFIQDNVSYNQQFSDLIDQLITINAWKGNLKNVENLLNKYHQQQQKYNLVQSERLSNVTLLFSLLGKYNTLLNQPQKIIAQRIKLAKQYQQQQKYRIQNELTNQPKDKGPNDENIQSWVHNQLKQTWLFVISSLLSRTNISTNCNYNKVCNTLLKNTERSSPKNVIKPLIVISSNLLRNAQYLQAEGMLSYALDRKRQNIGPQLLKSNQQYFLLNLLLGKTFSGVERKSEAQRLFDQYGPIFNLQLFLMQALLLDSL